MNTSHDKNTKWYWLTVIGLLAFLMLSQGMSSYASSRKLVSPAVFVGILVFLWAFTVVACYISIVIETLLLRFFDTIFEIGICRSSYKNVLTKALAFSMLFVIPFIIFTFFTGQTYSIDPKYVPLLAFNPFFLGAVIIVFIFIKKQSQAKLRYIILLSLIYYIFLIWPIILYSLATSIGAIPTLEH